MNDEKLREYVNQSGFPLQVAISDMVDRTKQQHHWTVLYAEHSWINELDESSGFIDLVLETDGHNLVLVVECKRVRDTSWIFLQPGKDVTKRRHAKLWLSRVRSGQWECFDWLDCALDPASPEAAYCIVRGEDPKGKPMLERVAADLVAATEALALEEKALPDKYRHEIRLYASVIVTTARLQACVFEPSRVSVSDGTMAEAEFHEVPFVRFRKQVSTRARNVIPRGWNVYQSLAKAKEHTVFVVNSNALLQFLAQFEIDDESVRQALGR